jgi:cell division protein FtsB
LRIKTVNCHRICLRPYEKMTFGIRLKRRSMSMIYRTLLLLVVGVVLPATSLAGQSRAVSDSQEPVTARAKVTEPASERAGEDEDMNVSQTSRVNVERFNVKQEFGQTRPGRSQQAAPEALRHRNRMKEAEVEAVDDDVDAVIAEQTRQGGDDDKGRTDKSDAARTLAPCPAGNMAAQSIAAAASSATSGDPAAAASNCTN